MEYHVAKVIFRFEQVVVGIHKDFNLVENLYF
jgi:hypothetical protein